MQRAAKLYEETGSTNETARIMELAPMTVRRYLLKLGVPMDGASNWLVKKEAAQAKRTEPLIELPQFPDEDIPVEDILDMMGKRFEVRKASHDAHTWFEVKVNDDLPIGVLWFGDPHIDDNGCNIPVLRRHAQLCATTPGLFGANIGDTTNNWAGRLIRLYAEQDASLKTARRLAKWFMLDSGVRWLVWLIGNHDCVTPDHEVLTRRGWVSFPEVTPSDTVLGFDHDVGCARWQPINEVVSFPYSGPIYNYKTNRFSIRCTPNHRFLARPNRRRYPFKYLHAEDLPMEFSVRGAASVDGRMGAPFSDDEIRLAAWLLADGSIDQNGYVSFYQSKEAGCAELVRLLQSCGFDYIERVRNRAVKSVCGRVLVQDPLPQRQFYLRAPSSRRMREIVAHKHELPAWCADMTGAQFDAFFKAYVDADGAPQWHGNSGAIYGTREFLNELHWLCAIQGQPSSLSQDNRGHWLLNYCFREEIDVARPAVVEQYDGTVWCLRVPMSNFLVRHNGRMHFTGNSWGDGAEVLAQMGRQHGTQKIICHDWEARFILAFPNGWKSRIHAAHDFKGHSQWNPLHGPMKAGQLGEEADLLICGDKHNWAVFEYENAARGHVLQKFIRVRGYKFMDDYARHLGLAQQQTGCAILTIFDPRSRQSMVFPDVETGVDILNIMRGQYAEDSQGEAAPTGQKAGAQTRRHRRREGNRGRSNAGRSGK